MGPTILTTQAGTYVISVAAVTVDGNTYGTSLSLITPSSFTLTVVNPCQSTSVTASSVSSITLEVWDLEKFYPGSGAAFLDFIDSVSSTNGDPSMCAKTYTATVSTNSDGKSLTIF